MRSQSSGSAARTAIYWIRTCAWEASTSARVRSSLPAPGTSAFAVAAPSARRRTASHSFPRSRPVDEAREERVAAADRVAAAHVERALEEGAVGRGEHHAVRAARHDAGVSVAARERAELLRGGHRLVAPRRRHAEQLARLHGVHLHDVGLGLEREAQPLALRVESHPHARRPRLGHDGPVPVRGRAAGHDPLIVSHPPGSQALAAASTSSTQPASGTSDPCS